MKVTVMVGRVDKAGRHNDRNFDITSVSHIDQNRISDNRYYTYNGNENQTFLELEKEYYDIHFSDYVNAQNEKNTQAGHKERNRTLDDYFSQKRTRPEDVILQIGDKDEHATGDELWECALEYKNKFNELFGDHCVILDMALHMDEATPHVHIRRVWRAEDEKGIEQVSQSKALKAMDIMMPDGSKAEDRYNNQKMTFTKIERDMFTQVCEDKGFIIDRTPGAKREHLTVEEYKELKSAETDIEALKSDIENIIQMALSNQRFAELYAEQLRNIEKKSLKERAEIARFLSRKYHDFLESSRSFFDVRLNNIDEENELQNMKDFLSEKGLLSEYEESKNEKSTHKNIAAKEEKRHVEITESFF